MQIILIANGEVRYMNQDKCPIYEGLITKVNKNAQSFHVPGHKNGKISLSKSIPALTDVLPFDLTELKDLDDLHCPETMIKEAMSLATCHFGSEQTYFLVNGSTVGNLVMVLSVTQPGDYVLVPKNAHKSVINALELASVHPIFIELHYCSDLKRYTAPTLASIKLAFEKYTIKAVLLTYPDYNGTVYNLKEIITYAHEKDAIVLVDEAHGVHFSLKDSRIPESSLQMGADLVVQSAHKMAPSLTMTAYLHIGSGAVNPADVEHYLQMLQSSSPSYLFLLSLDITRHFLATLKKEILDETFLEIKKLREILSGVNAFDLIPSHELVDPFKLTTRIRKGYDINQALTLLEENGVDPEYATSNEILFIHGLVPYLAFDKLLKVVDLMNRELKKVDFHDTIEDNNNQKPDKFTELVYTYQEMRKLDIVEIQIEDALDHVAAESIIPYPPGIPIILKGQRIKQEDLRLLNALRESKVNFQNSFRQGLKVYKGEKS